LPSPASSISPNSAGAAGRPDSRAAPRCLPPPARGGRPTRAASATVVSGGGVHVQYCSCCRISR
jgi:hypothetical protein